MAFINGHDWSFCGRSCLDCKAKDRYRVYRLQLSRTASSKDIRTSVKKQEKEPSEDESQPSG